MSRTYRRKNAWDKKKYVPETLSDYDREYYHKTGMYEFAYCKGTGRYHGCTDEHIIKALNARYHAETSDNWSGNTWKKEYCRWFMRNKNNHELRMAIKNGEEDSLSLTGRRYVCGQWWYYD